jgi:hypothetical protein
MPEEQPLERFRHLEVVFESKNIVLVVKLLEIEELCTGLHDGEWRRLGIVDEDGNAPWRLTLSARSGRQREKKKKKGHTIGVQAQEPFLLLLIGREFA